MNAYRIETERLIIRCYNPSDAALFKEAIDESIEHLLPWMPFAKNEPETLEKKIDLLRRFRGQFDLNQSYTYGIFNQDESKFIGSTGFHVKPDTNVFEIGYWLSKNETGKGYIIESTKALIKVGFEIAQKQRIEIHCDPNNIKSYAIPQKLGFNLEATLKNRLTGTDGNLKDEMIWTLFKEDYEKSNLKNIKLNVFDSANRLIKF